MIGAHWVKNRASTSWDQGGEQDVTDYDKGFGFYSKISGKILKQWSDIRQYLLADNIKFSKIIIASMLSMAW